MRTNALAWSAALLLLAAGCESDEVTPEDSGTERVDAAVESDASAESDDRPSSTAREDRQPSSETGEREPWVMRTDEFTIDPGQERYLCFAKTLEEDLVIGGYSSAAQPFVHHLVFSRALAPEPEGFSECNTLFRMTWEPLYITGAGDAKLEFPRDAGHKLPKGTQLVVQMHLLNLNDEELKGRVEIDMHRSAAANPRPVSTFVLGTTDLELPPNRESQAQGTCVIEERVQLLAGFPHMHLLGTSLRLEVGPSMDSLRTVFTRDPYDFDDQHIEPLPLTLEPGDIARVTCGFDNTRSEVVEFGESTNTEMCFFIAFALDRDELTSCTEDADDP